MRRDRLTIKVAVWIATCGLTGLAWAQDLTLSVAVDKTAVKLHEPVTLTLTVTGDVSGADFSQLEFPEGFVVSARSQATNFSIRAGAVERSLTLSYVLIPQRAGTFQLGPFTIEHRKQTFQTEPIEITVEEAALPSPLKPQGERFTL
jgi:uncharacterized protein (DUF58 family)